MSKKIDALDLDWLFQATTPPGGWPESKNEWYRIEAKAGKTKTATVYVFDTIEPWGVGSREFSQRVAGLDVDQIDLHLNSPGGLYPEGIAIMNVLRQHKAHVTATVDGMAASAASLVAMGADEVVMSKGSQLMIHEASGLVYGQRDQMLKAAELLAKTNEAMAEIYAEKAGGTAAEWLEALHAETWYSAQEAVDARLADRLDATTKEDEVVAARTKWDLSVFAHAGRDKAPAPYTPTAGPPVNNNEEDEEMPNKYLVQVATSLGIENPDKFEDDDKLSKAIETAQTDLKTKAEAKPPEAGGDKPESKAGKTPTNLPDGMIVVDKATIEALQSDVQESRKVAESVKAERRDAALDLAIEKGKIPASRKDHWTKYWDSDPEGAQAALAALPENLVPVAPIGRGDSGEDNELDADYRALYPEGSGL